MASRHRVSAISDCSCLSSRTTFIGRLRNFWVCSRARSNTGAQNSALWPSTVDWSRRFSASSCWLPVHSSDALSQASSALRKSTVASLNLRSVRDWRAKSCRAVASFCAPSHLGPASCCSLSCSLNRALSFRLRWARSLARPSHRVTALVHRVTASLYNTICTDSACFCDWAIAAFKSTAIARSLTGRQPSGTTSVAAADTEADADTDSTGLVGSGAASGAGCGFGVGSASNFPVTAGDSCAETQTGLSVKAKPRQAAP